jgi:hypothetical protein
MATWFEFTRIARLMPITTEWIIKSLLLSSELPATFPKLMNAAPQMANVQVLHHLGPWREVSSPTTGFTAAGRVMVNKAKLILVGVQEYCRVRYKGTAYCRQRGNT